ncbi:MAG TPA: HAMP domain-containing sensor histidine kinase [Burkholderiales bacterium]|jgi:two-component system sensor histidine kinase GlrK|nr:HAMP domain-containing sensor histidine kinase [Burkholderiales bacterium]
MLEGVKAAIGSAGRAAAATLPYPRSFLGLLLTAFTLVMLPLVGALAYSAWNTERLAGLSRSAVFNASQAARASRSLIDRIAAIERVAQQIAVLNDPELAVDYARIHRSFKQLADEIAELPLDDSQASALSRTVEQEQSLYDLLTEHPRPKIDTSVVSTRMDGLIESAREVLAINNRIVDREVHRLRLKAEQVQRGLIVLVFFSTAVALTIALALTRYIARPISEIDGAIRQLGGADFSRPIAVRGPEDLRYLGRRLDWLRRRLDEFETQKNRFLRHVSHELKTPLTAIREGAELLNDKVAGPLAPMQTQVVSIMRDNSVKLQRLIEELLDFQRALHAAASLEVRLVELDELVHDAARPHELAAQAKGLRLSVEAQKATLEADPQKLRSIVDNLISNAVKFTPPGGSISVRARALSGEAVIEVMDSGPGVPLEERESIFNLFFRGRTKSESSVKGSGLGLAIARELVEAHGGQIAVVGGGSGGHFRVTLPRRSARALADAA